MLTNGREKVGTENLKNPTAFMDYSQTINDVYANLEDCNPVKERRVLIVFDDMIADMEFLLLLNCFLKFNVSLV